MHRWVLRFIMAVLVLPGLSNAQSAAGGDATPVDDQGTPVTLHAYDAIGRELVTLYRSLESRDLAAGSPAARRLFS